MRGRVVCAAISRQPFHDRGIAQLRHARDLREIVATVLSVGEEKEPPAEIVEPLVGLASTLGDDATLAAALERIGKPREGRYTSSGN